MAHHDHGEDGHTHGDHAGGDQRGHGHTHGAIDPALFTSERGMWAVKWSLVGLGITALLQLAVVAFTGSVAVLADMIHNLGDAATAVPLWIAFALGRMKPTSRFTYGYGRAEDLAGLAVVLMIAISAVAALYESITRLFDPKPVEYLWAVVAAGVIGFAGNEIVAQLRIRVARQIGSAALEADGKHARADGLVSLAVVAGAAGIALGYPIADPIAGLVITLMIVRIVWESVVSVFSRLLDGVDPEVVDEVRQVTAGASGVEEVTEIRVRWLGHRMLADVNLAVRPQTTVEDAHEIARQVEHDLLHRLNYLSMATIHVDPVDYSGEEHHRIDGHAHDELAEHSHR